MTVDVDRSSLNYSNHHSYGIQEILQNNTFYKVTYYPYIDEYSIEHLYDRSNKAEYYERHTVYYQHSPRAEADWELIKKIHKKDLGKTFYDPDKQLDRDALPDGMWIVTFEYDFFTNRKPIVVTGPPYNCVIDCKLTFLHEWYQKSFFWMPTTGGSYVILTNKEGHCKIMTND
ncbi:MAG: hypothetical protein K0B08_10510 [Bacteroidales bacterium]|nr:hypothetical protein [Bacteroidales bacterium]